MPITAQARQPAGRQLDLDAPRVAVHHEHEFSTRARRQRIACIDEVRAFPARCVVPPIGPTTAAPTPKSAPQQFAELARAFDRGALATLFDRDPDTVGRWRQRQRVPHTVESTVDRFWWVMHVACVDYSWPVEAVKYFLLSIEPQIGRRPAELVRESDDQTRIVIELFVSKAAEQRAGVPTPVSPFAVLLAEEPLTEDVLVHKYRTPSITGRARPVGGLQEELDEFRPRYTAKAPHAIPLGTRLIGA